LRGPHLDTACLTLRPMAAVPEALRRIFRAALRWTTSARSVPAIEQTAWERATADASSWANSAPIRFGGLSAAGAGAVGVLAAVLTSETPLIVQILCGLIGAVVGFYAAVFGIVGFRWLSAFRLQRNEAREALTALETAETSEAEHEATKEQFAQAIRLGQTIPVPLRAEYFPLSDDWKAKTEQLIRETFGELEATRFAARENATEKRVYLDELASELSGKPAPKGASESWRRYSEFLPQFQRLLEAELSTGRDIAQDLLTGVGVFTTDSAEAWFRELTEVLELAPQFRSMAQGTADEAIVMYGYPDVDEEVARVLNRLEHRIMPLERMIDRLGPYLAIFSA
jgi:hypothetical protein